MDIILASDGEVSVLEILSLWSPLSLPLLPSHFRPGVVVSVGQIDLFKNYLYLIRILSHAFILITF